MNLEVIELYYGTDTSMDTSTNMILDCECHPNDKLFNVFKTLLLCDVDKDIMKRLLSILCVAQSILVYTRYKNYNQADIGYCKKHIINT
jgi:hypothetical protein